MAHRLLILLIAGVIICATWFAPPLAAQSPNDANALIAKAQTTGFVRVIIGLRTTIPIQAEGRLRDANAIQAQRLAISRAQDTVLMAIVNRGARDFKKFTTIPYLAMRVDSATLLQLGTLRDVISIKEDQALAPSLAESVPLIGAPNAWASGYAGANQVIAILDTGVESAHPFLASKVVSEACYSSTNSTSTSICPGGVNSTATGSAAPCAISGCEHGTHVAGIAAGKDNGSIGFSGVARDANVIAIQVFSRFDDTTNCPSGVPCVKSWTSDLILALERVQALSATYNIAAVNLSLGGGRYISQPACDADYVAMKTAIDHLRALNIATVIASGNSGYTDSLSAPGCISSAISVGSTRDGSGGTTVDAVSSFSNSATFLNLLAPGEPIRSSIPGSAYATMNGTSMATPHVAGTWAILKSRSPNATVDQILSALAATGLSITDSRNGFTKPRIRVDSALAALTPMPTLTSISPTTALASGAGFTINITGTSFITNSVVQWNGAPKTTTFITTTQLGASIATSDIITPGATINVTVLNPGIGTSNALPFTINKPAPTISAINPTNATAGGASFTITVTGTNFVSNSRVRWNGADRTTTFINNTRLDATINAPEIITAGTANVSVFTPAPGGGASSDLTFTIKPQCLTLSITVDPESDGTVNPSIVPNCSLTTAHRVHSTLVTDLHYTAGTVITLTASANTNFTFNKWIGCESANGNACVVTMSTAKSITANFTANCFAVTPSVNPNASGTIVLAPPANCGANQYNPGTTITVTAIPNLRYNFQNWSGDLSGAENPKSLIVDGNKNIIANLIRALAGPASVTASDGTYADHILVSWSGVAGADSYKLYRSTTNDPNTATLITTSPVMRYEDRATLGDMPYFYWVKAVIGGVDSAFSPGDPGSRASAWQFEIVNWVVSYNQATNRIGIVQKPGASRVRIHFATISLAPGDRLKTNMGDEWSGYLTDITSIASVESNRLTLTLISNGAANGYFVIDRIEWQGSAINPAIKLGELFLP